MKFVCDRCQTKYSIADEKVRGKVLKVRCKTCANVVTVREASAAPSGGGRASAPSLSPVRPSSPSMPAVRPTGTPRASQPSLAPARPTPARAPGPAPQPDDELEERTVIAPQSAAMAATPAPRRHPTRPLGPGPSEGDGVQWFMALDGEQLGPFVRKNLIDRLMGLPRDADVHVWNELMDGWKEPKDVAEVARGIAARRKAAPPPPPRPPVPRATPAPPLAPVGAGRGRTQPLPGPLSGSSPRLPRPSAPHLALSVHAPPPPPHEALGEDIDPSSLLGTPTPVPAPSRQKTGNGTGAHAFSGRAAAPTAPMSQGESDALNALNLGAMAGAAPATAPARGLRNGGHGASAARGLPASAMIGWDASAGVPEVVQSRHRGTWLILGFFAVVAVICVVMLFNGIKKAPPPVPPAFARTTPGESQFASLAEKIAQEKPQPLPTPTPPPQVVAPPAPRRSKGSPGRGRGGRPGHGVAGRAATPAAPATAPAPPAPEDPSAARFRENGSRKIQVPGGSAPGRGAPGQADISRVINNNKIGIKTCYQRALLRDSSLTHGKINVRVSIGISGRVKDVAVDGPQHFKVLDPCIRDMLSRWVFPTSSEEYGTEFSYVFQGNE